MSTSATIATAAVKATALALVEDLKANLARLEIVLREDETGQTEDDQMDDHGGTRTDGPG